MHDIDNFYIKIMEFVRNEKRIFVELYNLKWIYKEHFNFLSETFQWETLRNWLYILKLQERVFFSEKDSQMDISGKIILPKHIKVIQEKDNKPIEKPYAWFHCLMFLTEIPNIRLTTKVKFQKINEFLRKRNSTIIDLPIKERSLQILGDEKELGRLVKAYSYYVDLLSLLKCYHTYEPIYGDIYSGSSTNLIIVLENRDTYASFKKCNDELSRAYFKGIFYGQGSTIYNSFPSIIDKIQEEDEILYFGDIDSNGIKIAQDLIRLWKELEPKRKIGVAEKYYDDIVELYKKSQNKIKAQSKTKRKIDNCGFSEGLFDKIMDIILKGERIPQEFLNYEILISNFLLN